MASVPYPFTANPSSSASSSRPPVQYPRIQPRQDQIANSPLANMAANAPRSQQRGFYAQAPSNSPSTASLLPPSARGPLAVQAAFAQGPLRSVPSNSDMVRSHARDDDDNSLTLPLAIASAIRLSRSMHRLTALAQHLKQPLFQASLYRTRQVLILLGHGGCFVNAIGATSLRAETGSSVTPQK